MSRAAAFGCGNTAESLGVRGDRRKGRRAVRDCLADAAWEACVARLGILVEPPVSPPAFRTSYIQRVASYTSKGNSS